MVRKINKIIINYMRDWERYWLKCVAKKTLENFDIMFISLFIIMLNTN